MASLVKHSKYWQKNPQSPWRRGGRQGEQSRSSSKLGTEGTSDKGHLRGTRVDIRFHGKGWVLLLRKQATGVHSPFPSPLFSTELEARASAIQQEKETNKSCWERRKEKQIFIHRQLYCRHRKHYNVYKMPEVNLASLQGKKAAYKTQVSFYFIY